MEESLPIGEAMRFGWEAVRKHFWFLTGLFGLVLLVGIGAFVFVALIAQGNEGLAEGLGALLNIASNTIVPTGSIAVALKLCNGERPALGEFIRDGKTLLFYFLSSLLYGMIVVTGIFLLIVPGIYMAVRLGQYGYFIVEGRDDPIEAIRHSWEATRGMTWNLIVFGLALFGLNLLGLLALMIGLAVTLLVSTVASAYIYRVLNKRRTDRLGIQKEASTPTPILIQ